METKSCFIMGLPNAGKTSFLAALWHNLNSSRGSMLTISKYCESHNHTYLSKISKNWVDGNPVSRTKREFEETELKLLLAHGNNIFEITFPDLSGETFQNQYEKRVIENSLLDHIWSSSSVLLFINPDKIVEPNLITTIPQHIRVKEDQSNNTENRKIKERVPRIDDPTQVQLVELLQFVVYIRNNSPIKLGIIISAWDLVEENRKHKENPPQVFVKTELPLLWQFITANKHLFAPKYFGVSAQGGALEDEQIRNRLLEITDPCDRIIVVDEQKERYNDITLPLYKIAGEDFDQ